MEWKNKTLFIAALIGSAVGLGNIWRFPYIASEEGIWFIVAYLFSVIAIGIPAFYLEIYTGSKMKKPLGELGKKLGKLSFLISVPLIVVLSVMSYYTIITAETAALGLGMTGYWATLGLTMLIHALGIWIVNKGLSEGIEKANEYLVSLLFLALILLFVYSKPWEHLDEIWKALDKLLRPSALLAGLSQALFSLSLGIGLLYTYAMFSKPKHLKSVAVISSLGDTIVALLAMLILFSIAPCIGNAHENFMFEAINSYFKESMAKHAFYILLFSAAFTSVISFYSFLKFNYPNLIYVPPFLSLAVGLGKLFSLDLIYIMDRFVVEPLLPLSLVITLSIYFSYWRGKRKRKALKES